MASFKFNSQEINAIKSLQNSHSYNVIVQALQNHLDHLDEDNRLLSDPNKLIKASGKAQMLAEVLCSIKAI